MVRAGISLTSFGTRSQSMRREPHARHRPRYTLVALTPVHNEEHRLRTFFRTNGPAVDGFVFLDDSSTDRTRDIVSSHPQTLRVVQKRQRRTFNDRVIRNLLLRAAAHIDAAWFIFIDADETIDPYYIGELRALLEKTDADILMVRRVNLWGSTHTYRIDYPLSDCGVQYKHRIFRKRRSMHISTTKRLHFPLIPYASARVRKTTVVLHHHACIHRADRQRMYQKYVQRYDPLLREQRSYTHLLDTRVRLAPVTRLRRDFKSMFIARFWRHTIR